MKKLIHFFVILLFFSCSKEDEINSCETAKFLEIKNLTNTTVQLAWAKVQSSLYEIQYGKLGFSLGQGTIKKSSKNFLWVNDLLPNTEYSFYVRIFCNDSQSFSDWSTPYSFVTLIKNPFCNNPQQLQTDFNNKKAVGSDFVLLQWSNDHFNVSEVEYGLKGFLLGNGTIQVDNNNKAHISGLESDTEYDFYVRNNCDDSGFSDWIGPLTIKTTPPPFNIKCNDPSNVEFLGNGSGYSGPVFYRSIKLKWEGNEATNWDVWVTKSGNNDVVKQFSTSSNEGIELRYTSGIVNGQPHDIYVRANCSIDGYSDWIGPLIITP